MTEMKKRIEELLLNYDDWGYTYRMSDYATNNKQEAEYAKEGLKKIKKLSRELNSVFKEELRKHISYRTACIHSTPIWEVDENFLVKAGVLNKKTFVSESYCYECGYSSPAGHSKKCSRNRELSKEDHYSLATKYYGLFKKNPKQNEN